MPAHVWSGMKLDMIIPVHASPAMASILFAPFSPHFYDCGLYAVYYAIEKLNKYLNKFHTKTTA